MALNNLPPLAPAFPFDVSLQLQTKLLKIEELSKIVEFHIVLRIVIATIRKLRIPVFLWKPASTKRDRVALQSIAEVLVKVTACSLARYKSTCLCSLGGSFTLKHPAHSANYLLFALNPSFHDYVHSRIAYFAVRRCLQVKLIVQRCCSAGRAVLTGYVADADRSCSSALRDFAVVYLINAVHVLLRLHSCLLNSVCSIAT